MQCTNCGATLPPGATTCPNCRAATPYNASSSGSPAQYEPTVYSPPPQFGTPPSANAGNPSPIDPTVVASQYQGTPPTSYGTPEAPPPPPGQNPYAPNPANSYNSPPPQQYGAPPMQQGAYMPPPQQGAYIPPPQQGGYGTPPRKRSRVGLIVGIVLLVVVLACVGISALVYNGIKQGVSSVTATVTASSATVTSAPTTATTPATTPSGGQATPPSGQSIDPTASGIITNIQTASNVDQNTATPTQLATTFTVQQPIYTTVDLHMNGQTGYTEAKWYADGAFVFTSKILAITDPTSAHAFFGATYKVAAQGAVEVYFCTQSNCSDAKLADVANFTVTSSGLHWQSQPPVAMMDINRP
jgi:hypothetical protein